MVHVIQVCWHLASWSCSQTVSKPVWHTSLLCVRWKTPDDGQRNCPKHVEFYSKNKFEKLMHLVGFTLRIVCSVVESPRVFFKWQPSTSAISSWPGWGESNVPTHVLLWAVREFHLTLIFLYVKLSVACCFRHKSHFCFKQVLLFDWWLAHDSVLYFIHNTQYLTCGAVWICT